MITSLFEKGDRRSFADRRQFSYAIHIPERRNSDRRRPFAALPGQKKIKAPHIYVIRDYSSDSLGI